MCRKRLLSLPLLFPFLLLLFSSASNRIHSQNTDHLEYLAPEKVLSFAEWLYHVDKDYTRAASEYTRYQFIRGSVEDSVQFRIALCKKRTGWFDESASLLSEIRMNYSSPWYVKAQFHLSHSLFLSARYVESKSTAQGISEHADGFDKTRSLRLAMLGALITKQWDEAEQTSQRLSDKGNPIWYSPLLEQGKSLPAKKPWVAAALAAAVPGLGKIYTSEWEDGLYTFAYVALSTWLAVDGFEKDGSKSVKGWLFGGLAGTLYFGNIYGAVESARRLNAAAEDNFKARIRATAETLGDEE